MISFKCFAIFQIGSCRVYWPTPWLIGPIEQGGGAYPAARENNMREGKRLCQHVKRSCY
ncbi:serine-type carboxypeptidase family domain protein [Burkholderia mallei]|nr:serine-type carboxypeptidase family domain protein [Burkholderia pseudomallei]KOS74309.1 serine-type carboxypeptidase family domain protein [Burkholderia mallei]KOT20268.1 serine-type carboxypeptidase family domain protein [Burkholderia mallei]